MNTIGQILAAELYNQAVRPERHASGALITGAHLAAAIEEAHENFDVGKPAVVLLPAREIMVEQPLPTITRPIGIVGMNRRLSSLRFTGTGQMFTFANCGFGPEGDADFPLFGDRPHTSMNSIRSGLTLRNFAVTGDRALAQDAFVFEGNCDNVLFEDVQALYFRGYALYLGKSRDGVRGNVRESHFSRFMFRRCGDRNGSKPTIYVRKEPQSPSAPGTASSTMLSFRDGSIVYPQGHGIHLHAPAGSEAGSVPITDIHFEDVKLQSQSGTADPNLQSFGDLIRIEGEVEGVTGNVAPVLQVGSHGYALWLGPDDQAKPIVDLTVKIQEAGQAVFVGAVQQAKLVLPRPYASGVLVEGKDFSSGQLVLIIDHDVNILPAADELALTGSLPVAVDFSANPSAAVDRFFGGAAVLEVRAAVAGHIGTLQRTTPSALVATFEPDLASTEVLAAPVFDKVLITGNQRSTRCRGRWGSCPAPVFSVQPSISPTGGTAGETTFTASDGTASDTTSYTRRWLLSGTPIGTGATILPASEGSLVLEVTATGPDGSTAVASSAAVTVAAAAPAPAPAPTPTPAPVFSVQPSISPTSGTAGETTFTASGGTASDTTSYTRRWLLSGTPIGTGATILPASEGSLVLEVTATGPDGSTAVASSAAVTVAAAAPAPAPAPTPTPAPVFSVQPSISPTSGTAGETTFTASDGTASDTTSYTRRWLLSGTVIGTGATILPASDGNLVLEVTATGPEGLTAVASSATVNVSAAAPAPAPTPIDTTAPTITSASPSGSYEEGTVVSFTVTANEEATFGATDGAVTINAVTGTGSYTIPAYDAANPTVAFQLIATDTSGNVGTKAVEFTVTQAAALVPWTAPTYPPVGFTDEFTSINAGWTAYSTDSLTLVESVDPTVFGIHKSTLGRLVATSTKWHPTIRRPISGLVPGRAYRFDSFMTYYTGGGTGSGLRIFVSNQGEANTPAVYDSKRLTFSGSPYNGRFIATQETHWLTIQFIATASGNVEVDRAAIGNTFFPDWTFYSSTAGGVRSVDPAAALTEHGRMRVVASDTKIDPFGSHEIANLVVGQEYVLRYRVPDISVPTGFARVTVANQVGAPTPAAATATHEGRGVYELVFTATQTTHWITVGPVDQTPSKLTDASWAEFGDFGFGVYDPTIAGAVTGLSAAPSDSNAAINFTAATDANTYEIEIEEVA